MSSFREPGTALGVTTHGQLEEAESYKALVIHRESCSMDPTFNPLLSKPIPSPPAPLTSAHHTPDPRPATSSPTPRAGALPPGRSRPAFASSAFSPFGPAAPRERDDKRMGKGCLLGPGPFCGPFKSRPLNPFISADRNCRPSPLRGRDQAAPSPTAAEPRAPSPPPGAG